MMNAGEDQVPAVPRLIIPAFRNLFTSSSILFVVDGGCLYGTECIGVSDIV